ncbi:MAG: sigma-E factor negative regulatory protein [Pseudomonadota bacterium]
MKKPVSSVGTQDEVRSVADEALSALMDDESSELELRRLLKSGDADPDLKQQWFRYNLARAAMHDEDITFNTGFAAQVRAGIDAEPEHQLGQYGQQKSAERATWIQSLGSFAVAASVACVVVIGGQQLASLDSENAESVARVAPIPVGVVNTTGAIPVPASFGTTALPTLQPADRTAYRELARQRLRRFSQEHAEHASLNTPQGMLTFARVPLVRQEMRELRDVREPRDQNRDDTKEAASQ